MTQVEVPLPSFRQPRQDPDLEPVASPTPAPELLGLQELPESAYDPSGELPPLSDPEGPTRRSWAGKHHGSGDAGQAAKVLGGVTWVLAQAVRGALYKTGRWFRMPTKTDVDGFARPLGRILVRFLPLAAVGPTLVDATEAVAAAHGYVMDGPLAGRYAAADSNNMGDTE